MNLIKNKYYLKKVSFMTPKYGFLFILLLLGMVWIAGCVSPNTSPSIITTTIPTPDQTLISIPTLEGSPEMTPASTVMIPTTALPEAVLTNKQYTEPFVSIKGINRVQYRIPDCIMGQILPVTHESGYGLNSIKEANLYFLSSGDFNKVMREYSENSDAYSVCYGIPETPYWGFMNVAGTFTARNPIPVKYNITMIVMFRGTEGPKYYMEMTMNPGQEYPFNVYIPIKVDQMPDIQVINFKFTQIT
jgi:hypothetical protein